MRVVWYWWGFRVYVDATTVQELIRALGQGEAIVRALLDRFNLGWLEELIRQLMSWGLPTLRAMATQCGGRGLVLNVPWSLWGSYISCG
jgi:hypothetical protein